MDSMHSIWTAFGQHLDSIWTAYGQQQQIACGQHMNSIRIAMGQHGSFRLEDLLKKHIRLFLCFVQNVSLHMRSLCEIDPCAL
jgi:hypothetical protein